MNRKERVQMIEELLDSPNTNRKLQQLRNSLKLLVKGDINIAEDLEWPEWGTGRGGKEREWLRKALFRAFDGRCFWTGKLLNYNDMEIDHIIPRKKGGPDNYLNYVPCHKRRNRKKHDSLNINLKLIATLYFVETLYGERLKEQVLEIREKAIRTKKKNKRSLHKDGMDNDEHSELFINFWDDYDIKVKEKIKTQKAQGKVQAFFQVLWPVFNNSSIRNKLWEQFNLEIANCSRQSWYGIINGRGLNYENDDYRQAVVNALRKMGIRGGRKRLSYDKIEQMGIFSMKKYLALTHFDKVVQKRIYQYPYSFDKGLDKELAKVMNQFAKNLEWASPDT